MSMLLGTRNSYANINTRSTGPGIPMESKPVYICRKCGNGFKVYAGVKRVGSGIGYCREHNPPKKEPTK